MQPPLKLTLHDAENSDDAKLILKNLIAFNERQAEKDDARELTITLRDPAGQLVAGLNGYTDWGWLFVKLLWIADGHRKNGLGTQLMKAAEEEGLKRGCHHAWLDTFSFQARGFYEKLGYEVWGELEDYPIGHSRYFLQKRLLSSRTK